MTIASASAASPSPVADTAIAGAQAPALNGGANFSQALDMILQHSFATQAAMNGTASAKSTVASMLAPDNDGSQTGNTGIAAMLQKIKGKTGTPDPAIAAAMQGQMPVAPTQTPVAKTSATQTPATQPSPAVMDPAQKIANTDPTLRSIDMNALRTSLAQKKTQAPVPVNDHTDPVSPAAGKSTDATAKTSADASAPAALVTQAKLTGALLQTANPNTTKTLKSSAADATVAKMVAAAKAQMAKPAQTPVAAPVSAQTVADAKTTAAKTQAAGNTSQSAKPAQAILTKIESAAMANATETAIKTPTPQAKLEAQALPVNFDAAAKAAAGKDAGTQSGTGDKDSNAKSGNDRTAAADTNNAAPPPQMKIADAQPAQPTQTHTAPATSTNMDAAGTGVSATNTMSPSQQTVTIQVAPQTPHNPATASTDLSSLGIAIAAKSKDGEKHFDISIHPAELGRVDVRLSVDSDGKAQAHLVAEKPQTLQLLQNDKANLERSLKDAGLDLSNNGLNFSLKGEQQQSTPTFNARSRALSAAAVTTTDAVTSVSSHTGIAASDSRLDIRV